ncbi:MAG: nickel pincer cofactor biosynthesis protein LarC [Bacteroidales bacterium]|nr:MAG: nickel pincer cofactor biosynthesis protein LarC [Bacteroidales bacterium]
MKIIYYECFAGISGDMNLGAMIDIGVKPEYLVNELKKLNVKEYELKISKDKRKGISGTKVDVVIKGQKKDTQQSDNKHKHRNLNDIRLIINKSDLKDSVKKLSLKIFEKVAKAEAIVHDKDMNEIYFHEVGAIDSIVDIVGAAICIDHLKPDKIYSSTVELGGGFINCAHGTLPVPAPASVEILKGKPVKKGTVQYEATTPTGAAILATCVDEFTDKINFVIEKTGYGIGNKDENIPNVLRVYLGSDISTESTEKISSSIVECNIDDMNPEYYDYIINSLFNAGAKDVFITPIIMKKSRPAAKLSILCDIGAEKNIEEILFKETSSLGLRKYTVEKIMLDRKIEYIKTKYGEVKIKSAFYRNKLIKSKPEYEDCIRIAKEQNIPINEVYRLVEKLMNEKDGRIKE